MLNILIDTREQTPWHFPPEMANVSRSKIDAGDYALLGDEFNFAIERKTLDDFVGTVSSGWERFLREIDRMIVFPAMVIIVECKFSDINQSLHNHSKLSAGFINKRIAELTLKGVSILFCNDPVMSAGMCWRILATRKEMIDELGI